MGAIWCRRDLSTENLWAVDKASEQTHSSPLELMEVKEREMLPEQRRRAVGLSTLALSTIEEQQSIFSRSWGGIGVGSGSQRYCMVGQGCSRHRRRSGANQRDQPPWTLTT